MLEAGVTLSIWGNLNIDAVMIFVESNFLVIITCIVNQKIQAMINVKYLIKVL